MAAREEVPRNSETESQPSFLIVSQPLEEGGDDWPWTQALKQALESLGRVDIAGKTEAIQRINETSYQAVIINKVGIGEWSDLISSLRNQEPKLKIIVASATPNSRESREAFTAGASDFIEQTPLNQEGFLSKFREILQ